MYVFNKYVFTFFYCLKIPFLAPSLVPSLVPSIFVPRTER